jgi:hypothetical protein
LPKANGPSFLKVEGNTPMDKLEKQDITIGLNDGKTPILASEDQNTEAPSKPAPIKSELASIGIAASQLALLQNDCSELQSHGLKIAILARNDKLYLVLEYPKHKLGFDTGTGHFLLDSVPVLKAMLETDIGK